MAPRSSTAQDSPVSSVREGVAWPRDSPRPPPGSPRAARRSLDTAAARIACVASATRPAHWDLLPVTEFPALAVPATRPPTHYWALRIRHCLWSKEGARPRHRFRFGLSPHRKEGTATSATEHGHLIQCAFLPLPACASSGTSLCKSCRRAAVRYEGTPRGLSAPGNQWNTPGPVPHAVGPCMITGPGTAQ